MTRVATVNMELRWTLLLCFIGLVVMSDADSDVNAHMQEKIAALLSAQRPIEEDRIPFVIGEEYVEKGSNSLGSRRGKAIRGSFDETNDDQAGGNGANRFIDNFLEFYSQRSLVGGSANHLEILEKKKDMMRKDPITCGGVISIAEGEEKVITTPEYPNNYPPGIECTWTLVAQLGEDNSQLSITVPDFDVEGAGCDYDYLSISDTAAGIKEVFCGRKGPKDFFSFSNSLALKFVSDDTENKRGFKIKVSGVKWDCGGVYDIAGDVPVFLSTPNYPATFPPGTRCHWLILSQELVGVELTNYFVHSEAAEILQIATEGFSDIQIYDTRKVYISKAMSITFAADTLATKVPPEPGVQLRVFPIDAVTDCNTTVSVGLEASVVINSNRYPKGYDANTFCWWRIQFETADGYIGRLKFADFDIEEQFQCNYDYLRIYDEEQAKNQKYCGFKRSLVYKTNSKEIMMYFKSDESDLIFYKGFSVYISLEQIRVDECTLEKTSDDTWIFKSPYLPYAFPAYAICNVNLSSEDADRFRVRFTKFTLQDKEKCVRGDYLEIQDVLIGQTDIFCGEQTGRSFITAGNNLTFFFTSDSTNVAEGFELEIKEISDGNCGGNFVLNPGDNLDLRAPANRERDNECVFVFQGNNSMLMLEFNKIETVRVSSTGTYNNLFDFNERTLDFIDPSENFMVLSGEKGAKIRVSAYQPFHECGSTLELKTEPVLIDNSGVDECSILVTRSDDEDGDSNEAIRLRLLSLSQSTCAVKVTDMEAGKSDTLCEEDWRQDYITSSRTVNVAGIIPRNNDENNFLLLVEPLQFTCGATYDVMDSKIIVRNRNLERGTTCVFRFRSNGERIVLDVATGSNRLLSLISVSTEGTFQTLKSLTSRGTSSLETTKDFLVVIEPLSKKVNFVIQVMAEPKVTNLCTTCLVLRPGSNGVVRSPTSEGLTTYPSGLSCDVKFEAEHEQQIVTLTINYLDLPKNTSVDRLSLLKGGQEAIIDPSRIPFLPFTLVEETPFSLRFLTSTDNEFEGYEIQYSVNECGGLVTLRSGDRASIRSPGDDLYPTYTRCVWMIQANVSNISDRIWVKVIEYDVDSSDTLQIFDPFFSSDPVVSLTGPEENRVITSIGNQLMIVFNSDAQVTRSGFELRVGTVASGCGADIDTAVVDEGIISTLDFFPNTNYCFFRLRPSEGRVMSLSQVNWRGTPEALERMQQQLRGHQNVRVVESKCSSGVVRISNTGFLNGSEEYCVDADIPDFMSTHDLLVQVLGSTLPPAIFSFRAGGCVRELLVSEVPVGSVTSPSFPDYFSGPLACRWSSRSPLLIRVTFVDLDPDLDRLILSDDVRNTTIMQYPRYVLLDGPSVISFNAESRGVRKGFSLDYETVENRGEWKVTDGHPVVILGRPGSQDIPSAWRVTGPAGVRGLSVLVWATYIPSDPECATHFLQLAGGADDGVRICGGAGLKTVHILGEEAILVLHSTSALSVLVASVHVML